MAEKPTIESSMLPPTFLQYTSIPNTVILENAWSFERQNPSKEIRLRCSDRILPWPSHCCHCNEVQRKASITGKVAGTEAIRGATILSFFYQLSNLSRAIELMCLYKRENEADLWKYNFLHSRAQPECVSELQPMIMSTMILDSLDNIWLR